MRSCGRRERVDSDGVLLDTWMNKVRRRPELVLRGLPMVVRARDDVAARAGGCPRPMVIEVDGGILARRSVSFSAKVVVHLVFEDTVLVTR